MANLKGLFMYELIKYILKTIVVSGCVVGGVVGCVAILYMIHNKISQWLKKNENKGNQK